MDKFYVICSVPLLLYVLIFLYFTRVRKNAFEERLALFRPTRHLSQRREAYMQGMHKYHKYATIMLLVILSFPLIVLILSMFEGDYEKISKVYMAIPNDMKMIILLVFVPIVMVYYLINYVLKRNEKAQRMLLEQMSDDDFDLLLKVKDSLPFISKYSPPFVLCNNQLYIFLFYAIREIDPAQITEINWSTGRDGIFVQFKVPKKITLGLSREGFYYFKAIIEKHNPELVFL